VVFGVSAALSVLAGLALAAARPDRDIPLPRHHDRENIFHTVRNSPFSVRKSFVIML
jgi:hypothetical protein